MVRRRKQYRINGRFFIFVAIIAVVVVVLCTVCFGQHEDYIRYAALSNARIFDSLIVFDETEVELPQYDKILYASLSGHKVQDQEKIAVIFKKGYILSAVQALDELYYNIVQYQENNLIKDIYKPELAQYSLNIETIISSMQAYRYGQDGSSLFELEQQLKQCMEEKQSYIRNNFTADAQLSRMYSDENEREAAIEDWCEQLKAEREGFVLWQNDASLRNLNFDTLKNITAGELTKLLKNTNVLQEASYTEQNSVRLVRNNGVCFVIPYQSQMNFASGQNVSLYVRGRQEPISASVYHIDKKEKIIAFKAEGVTEQFIGQRFVQISTAPIEEGLVVSQSYIRENANGAFYILAQTGKDKKEVEIRAIARYDGRVLIEPVVESDLHISQKIYS